MSTYDLIYEFKREFLACLDTCGIRYVLYSDFLSGPEDYSSDLDLIIASEDREKFLAVLRRYPAARKPSETGGQLEQYIVYQNDFLFMIDVRYGIIVSMHDGSVWELPMELNGERVRLPSFGYRLVGSTLLVYLAALFSSPAKGVRNLADGWTRRSREKWLAYYHEFSSEVEHSDEKELLHEIYSYSISSRRSLVTEPWIQQLKKQFVVGSPSKVKERPRIRIGMNMVVWIEGPDGSGKSTLIKRFLQSSWPLGASRLYLGYGVHGWKFKFAKQLSLTPPTLLKKYPRLLAILQSFVVLPLEFGRRQVGVFLQAGNSLVLIDRMPLKILASRNVLIKKMYNLLLPAPELVVLLTGNPEVIAQRKPEEVKPEDVVRLTNEARSVIENLNIPVLEVDTTAQSVDEVVRQTLFGLIREVGGFEALCARFRLVRLGPSDDR